MRSQPFEQPYPLRSRFLRYIVPGLLLVLVVSVVVTSIGARQLAEGVYLEQATRRAQVIDRAMTEAAPEHWYRLKQGEAPGTLYLDDGGRKLLRELDREVKELDLSRLKIYSGKGVIQYATEAEQIGTTDRSDAFVAAIDRQASTVVLKKPPNGSALYELYVLVNGPQGSPVVFELYEPVAHLDALLLRTGLAAAGVPSAILIALMLAMLQLVFRAQRDIDGRAGLVTDLRERLERLLSGAAAQAVHTAVSAGGSIPSRRLRCTILYADIRQFSSFAERNEPELVVALLNRSMKILVEAVKGAGGDVDKMIGDALMARFQGEDAEARAIAVGQETQRALAVSDLPWGVGIGIYTGDVISGTIGTSNRMDFTVIGDAVNVSARLCSAAAMGEIVADARTIAAARVNGFEAAQVISVKGRQGQLEVQRWSCAADTHREKAAQP